jgi:hypothetical protein
MLVARARSEQSDRFVHYVLQPAPGAPDGELLHGTLLDDLPSPFGLVVFLARSRLVLLEQAFDLLSRPVPPVLSLGSEDNWHLELDRCRALYGGWVASQARPNALLVFSFAPFATMPAMVWDDIEAAIVVRIDEFRFALGVVNKYGSRLGALLQRLDALLKQTARPDVQVELLTVHAAKGLQYRTVQLADDLVELAAFKVQDGKGGMAWPAGGDAINLWYVALTRATHTLVLPPKFLALVQDMRSIGSAGATSSHADAAGSKLVLGSGQSRYAFSQEEVVHLRRDLYDPWLACGGGLVLASTALD